MLYVKMTKKSTKREVTPKSHQTIINMETLTHKHTLIHIVTLVTHMHTCMGAHINLFRHKVDGLIGLCIGTYRDRHGMTQFTTNTFTLKIHIGGLVKLPMI